MNEWGFPNAATPPGSSAYYSVRFAPRDLRCDLAAILAWRYLVREIPNDVSDPGIARIKLEWWRRELECIFADKPYHPLSLTLQPVVKRHALSAAPFIEITDQAEAQILRQQPARDQDLIVGCERDLGSVFELVARCHGVREQDLLQTSRRLGGFCAQVYLIRDSGALVRQQRPVFSNEQLRMHGLSIADLAQRGMRRRFPNLLAPAAVAARAQLAASHPTAAIPACIRIRTRILESLLGEIERSGFEVADQQLRLTPLRKLWLGWRESRRRS